tara:strand:+ start:1833 stop:2177 length:345 start_codon:yes stop_codon:yes gene_type:complete
MKIDIEDGGRNISVKVRVKPIHRKDHNVKEKITTTDILEYLQRENVKVGKCIQNPSLVTNRMGRDKLSGEWIFEKPKKPVKSIRKPKKVKKTLDKSREDVIIEVQEKTLLPKEE